MIIDYNKKIKVPNPRPHSNGGNNKQKAILGQSNPKPQQVHFHENDPLLIILPQKLLVKPWYKNVYLMVEWTHMILNCHVSFQGQGWKTTPRYIKKCNTHQR